MEICGKNTKYQKLNYQLPRISPILKCISKISVYKYTYIKYNISIFVKDDENGLYKEIRRFD